MKHLKKSVLEYLETEERFRERRNKNKGITELLRLRYPILQTIGKDVLTAALEDYAGMDRQWRLILQERPDLRGKDYTDKEELELKAQEELGYGKGDHTPSLI